jgi:hypothetical protein
MDFDGICCRQFDSQINPKSKKAYNMQHMSHTISPVRTNIPCIAAKHDPKTRKFFVDQVILDKMLSDNL